MTAVAVPPEKVQRALRLLLFRRGRRPGVRDWELEAKLGQNYEEVVERAGAILSELGLQVKGVVEESPVAGEEGAKRYVVVLAGQPTVAEAKFSGWRIDSLAGLAATMGLILARQGRAPRDEVEDLIAEKLGLWRAESLVDAFLRSGYLQEDADGFLGLDWRTYAEVDLPELAARLQAASPTAAPLNEAASSAGQARTEESEGGPGR